MRFAYRRLAQTERGLTQKQKRLLTMSVARVLFCYTEKEAYGKV